MAQTEKDIERIITRMMTGWFYASPVIYVTVCKNPICKNRNMSCEVRSGKSRIEYNPDLLAEKTPAEIKKAISLEISRIILGHCTSRRPEPFDAEIAIKASNMAILQENLEGLPAGQSFEFYYNALRQSETVEAQGESDGEKTAEGNEAGDATALWNDGNLLEELAKKQEIKEIQEDENGEPQIAALFPGMNPAYRENEISVRQAKVHDRIHVAKIFMASAQGLEKRVSVRNRPNRRFGFMQMGTKYEKGKVHLLCVIDVSGSVSDEWIEQYVSYLNFIKRKYKPVIDIVEADTEIKEGSFFRMKRRINKLQITGRGGTDFQCVIDFLADRKRKGEYDGAIIFTDGGVGKPDVPKGFTTRILWAVNEKNAYFEKEFSGEKYVAYLKN